MSNSLYENYFSGDSNSKAKDDHNFELGSFDANMMQENINNQTLGSSRRDEENCHAAQQACFCCCDTLYSGLSA